MNTTNATPMVGQPVPLIDLSEWEPLSPDVSEEELDRRAQSNEKRYTTAEVLAQLEKRQDVHNIL
ncbi:MAG TPA: hypothetical protein VN688_10155 [Gemmataceae bacterium]|nr:hypothetical protein [Gemmataceae bacterium]